MFSRRQQKEAILEEMSKMSKEEILQEMRAMAQRGEIQSDNEEVVRQEQKETESAESVEDKKELFEGSKEWHDAMLTFLSHPFSIKLLAFFVFSFGLMHVGATFMFETERKALYNAFGEEVKLHWEERIGCYKGYCFKVERVDYQEMNYPTLAEKVAEANRMERLKYGISKERQDNWHRSLDSYPANQSSPDSILSELGMAGDPSGH